MRPIQSLLLAAFVCLLPAFGAAAGITRITPNPLPLGSVEEFMTIHGTELLGDPNTIESIEITIAGPAGEYVLQPNSAYHIEHEAQIVFWVPWQVAVTPGQYSVVLSVKHFDVPANVFGPDPFSVALEPEVFGPPQLILPEVVIAEATSANGAIVYFDAFAVSQHNGQQIAANCNMRSGDAFPLGSTAVQCSASDINGSAQGEFQVYVQDTVRPTMTLPADIVTTNPVVTYVVTATDSIDGPLTPSCFPASGATFPFGTTEVSCVAEDSQLNPVYGTFKVTVTDGSPVLTVPADITAEATSGSGAVVSYTTSATNSATISCSPASGSTFPLGKTVVSCTATNAAGSDVKTFNVTVVDTTPPQILEISTNPATLWPPDHKMVAVTVSLVTFDIADATPVARIISVKSNQPVDGTGDGDTAPDWIITGPLKVDLRAERSANTDRVYTITVEVIDDAGNATQRAVEVRVTQTPRRRSVR